MSRKKLVFALIASVSLHGALSVAWAAQGNEGGHGGFVVHAGGGVQLEDAVKKAEEYGNVLELADPRNEELANRISYYLDLMAERGIVNVAKFRNDFIFDEDIEYRFVTEFPEKGNESWNMANSSFGGLKDDSGQPIHFSEERFGWTDYGLKATLLKPGLFFQLSVDDQALAIIHERLHAFAGDSALIFITDFVYLLKQIGLYYEEAQVRIDPALPLQPQIESEIQRITGAWTAEKAKNIELFGRRARQLGFQGNMYAHPNGGGRVSDDPHCRIDLTNFVGMGAEVVGCGAEPFTDNIIIGRSKVAHARVNRTRWVNSELDAANAVAEDSSFFNSELCADDKGKVSLTVLGATLENISLLITARSPQGGKPLGGEYSATFFGLFQEPHAEGKLTRRYTVGPRTGILDRILSRAHSDDFVGLESVRRHVIETGWNQ